MTTGDKAARLYTANILGLAVELVRFPITEIHTLTGEARSRSCGSTVTLGFAVDSKGSIGSLGLRVAACAIGQASAALFAKAAEGKTLAELENNQAAITRWLTEHGSLPDWPEIEILEKAKAYPARHGAILLPWNAAIAALSKADVPR